MRFQIILFISIVLAACAAAAPDECEWGESYWCSDLRIASRCGAVQHCKTTIWHNEKLEADGTEVCAFCETVIGDVRKFIEDQQEQKVIEQYLEAACTIIPSQSLAAECKDMVSNYLSVVLDLLASELDPQVVCATMKLCQGFSDSVQHAALSRPILQAQNPTKNAPPICTDCKKFFQDIKEMVTSAAMEKELEQYIEQILCAQLGSLSSTCNELVEKYVPAALDMMASEFDPAEVCGMFGFCNATMTPGKLIAGLKKHATLQQELKDGTLCTVCHDIFGVLTFIEQSQEVQKEIEDFIKSKLCASLGELKSQCDDAVTQYLPVLFDLLFKELNADVVCKELGVCDSTNIPGRMFTPKTQETSRNVATSVECVLCEFIMKELDDMLTSNASESEILAALDKVCGLLPDTLSGQCSDFIKEYGPAVLAILKAEMDPTVVCTTLGLCSQKRLQLLRGDEECGVCETIISYLESILEQNATITEIEKLMDKICNFLPDNIRNDCDYLVDTYAPQIVNMVSGLVDPNEVCTLLGLCKNNTVLTKSPSVSLTRLVAAVHEPQIVKRNVQLLGKNECTWGPSHWCKDMETANKCDMVDHCQKNVWSKENL